MSIPDGLAILSRIVRSYGSVAVKMKTHVAGSLPHPSGPMPGRKNYIGRPKTTEGWGNQQNHSSSSTEMEGLPPLQVLPWQVILPHVPAMSLLGVLMLRSALQRACWPVGQCRNLAGLAQRGHKPVSTQYGRDRIWWNNTFEVWSL